MGMTASGITAAICTRNRPQACGRALRSLLSQETPPLQVVVIDSAPADDRTATLVRQGFPGVEYQHEPVPGLDAARNRALAVARHDTVAFLDDDAVAEPDWVSRIAETLDESTSIAACMGRIDPLVLETAAQRLIEANGGMSPKTERRLRLPRDAPRYAGLGRAPDFLCAMSFGAGCNFAVRRQAALGVGGFDEALGAGTALPGGDENDMLWRLLQRGFECVFEPAMRVRHEHRADMESVARQLAGYEHAMVAWLTKLLPRSKGRERFLIAAFLAWRLIKPGTRLVKRATGREPLPSSILWRMWAGCWRGLAAYPRSRRQALERREATS